MHGGLHHLHVRKRIYSHLSPFPHPVRWKRHFDHLMYVISVLTPLALLPQVWHLYTTHDASGLSLASWLIITIIKLFWILYGFIHRAWPIAISSTLFAIIDFSVLFGIFLYS